MWLALMAAAALGAIMLSGRGKSTIKPLTADQASAIESEMKIMPPETQVFFVELTNSTKHPAEAYMTAVDQFTRFGWPVSAARVLEAAKSRFNV